MKFKKKVWVTILFLSLLFAGCNKNTNITQIPDSPLLHASNEPVAQENLEKQVGTIKQKVSSEKELADWFSLHLEKGTAIYLINNSDNSEPRYAYEKNGEYFTFNEIWGVDRRENSDTKTNN